jgi:hypothetical protein
VTTSATSAASDRSTLGARQNGRSSFIRRLDRDELETLGPSQTSLARPRPYAC